MDALTQRVQTLEGRLFRDRHISPLYEGHRADLGFRIEGISDLLPIVDTPRSARSEIRDLRIFVPVASSDS